jgi:hypothetical protein
MTTRHHPRDLRALKALFGELVHRVGGVDAASAALEYSKSHLSEAASLRLPGSPRVDHVAELEAIAGEPLVTAHLARLAGCLLLPQATETGCPHQSIAAVLRGSGELGASVAAALSDGALDRAEADLLVGALDTLLHAATQARARLAARRG